MKVIISVFMFLTVLYSNSDLRAEDKFKRDEFLNYIKERAPSDLCKDMDLQSCTGDTEMMCKIQVKNMALGPCVKSAKSKFDEVLSKSEASKMTPYFMKCLSLKYAQVVRIEPAELKNCMREKKSGK